MSSNIPRAREILADALASARTMADYRGAVETALRLMTRASPARRRAPEQSQPMDDALARRVRAMAHGNPDMPLAEIAAQLGVNPGRVSEALHGQR